MTATRIDSMMAERVMGWRTARGRFLRGDRRWTPHWRFQPTTRVADAFRLLEHAAPTKVSIISDNSGAFRVTLQIYGRTSKVTDRSKARAITLAVALAMELEVGLDCSQSEESL